MEKNKKLKAQLPKGFRDNSEDNIDIRNQVINIIRNECDGLYKIQQKSNNKKNE